MERLVWRLSVFALVVGMLALAGGKVVADDEDFEDFSPGLVGTYASAQHSVRRVDEDIAFVWGADVPDQRLRPGDFTANWNGRLLVKNDTTYRFHAFVQGDVKVTLGGRDVLSGSLQEPGWINGEPVEFEFGFHPLVVDFKRTAPEARIHLYWSSERFPLEPVPAHLLFYLGEDESVQLADKGRVLFDAHRCNRCHVAEGEVPSPAAPALTQVTAGLNPDWLVAKLQGNHPEAAHSRMPDFGLSEAQASDIAEYLRSIAQDVPLVDPPKPKAKGKEKLPSGETLIRSSGCLACHVLGDLGQSGPFGGGDLTRIGARRSADWIYTQLLQPTRVNTSHRMPEFKLTPTQRSIIATTLSKQGRDGDVPFGRNAAGGDKSDAVRRGRELVDALRCSACHKTPLAEPDLSRLPKLTGPVDDVTKSCLGEQADRKTGRPVYRNIDRDAIQAYLATRQGPLSTPSEFEHGELVLSRRNCLSCHERGLATGIVPTAGKVARTDPEFFGQSQALIPPSLTAVGDKLYERALAESVVAGPSPRRRPWLQIQMPKFAHTSGEVAALTHRLLTHDRIPEGAPPEVLGYPVEPPEETDSSLLAGRTLMGASGLSCIACHQYGDYVPPKVAIATRGSNLFLVGNRIRREFFHRWTRSPLRIVPGMEMPAFERPVPGVLDGHIETQMAAIWAAINDPRFDAPTDSAVVEQLLVVDPDSAPRIVRDVFTVSEANGGGSTARAFAVGFPNAHGVLIDADSMAVRSWTYGEFARQRTQGKSWFWDLAGADVATGWTSAPEIRLQQTSADRVLEPVALQGRSARLHSYRTTGDAIELTYDLTFPTPGKGDDAEERTVSVTETLQAIPKTADGRTGWRRQIALTGFGELLPVFQTDNVQGVLGSPQIRVGGSDVIGRNGGDVPSVPFQVNTADGTASLTVDYMAGLTGRPLPVKPRPERPRNEATVTTARGFVGERLNLPADIMPTAFAWNAAGELVFTSLKGHVYIARDTDDDGIEDELVLFEEGLAVPFGVIADGDALLVAHKPELIRLRDTDGDGRADERTVVADGWGYTDDYHDWTTGPVRDSEGNLYVAVGSDYAQKKRTSPLTRWRGTVLRIAPDGTVEPIARGMRYPIGIAADAEGRLFVSDQQGVANTFNEVNHVVPGRFYGVAARDDQDPPEETRPAVQIPHPWTRSVNGLAFLPEDLEGPWAPFAGHGVGFEYNNRFLVRFTTQEVNGELQGASYALTGTEWDNEQQTFLGPICGAVGPDGALYVGSIHDSGWLGGQNTGEIVRLRPDGSKLPNGIRELRATPEGFEIEFVRPVDAKMAEEAANYQISGYTRVWEGSYATPDSGRYQPRIGKVQLSADGRVVRLAVDDLREKYVYELTLSVRSADGSKLSPEAAHYTMNSVPQ